MPASFRLPYGYRFAPPWPSLYWPFGPDFDPLNLVADIHHSLYYLQGTNFISQWIMKKKKNAMALTILHADIWRFTVIWSLLFSLTIYLPAGNIKQ
jgi:hypothetical protein